MRNGRLIFEREKVDVNGVEEAVVKHSNPHEKISQLRKMLPLLLPPHNTSQRPIYPSKTILSYIFPKKEV